MALFDAQPHRNYDKIIKQPLLRNQPEWSLTTMELKKPHPSKLVGGVEVWNGLVPHTRVVDKNLGGISQE